MQTNKAPDILLLAAGTSSRLGRPKQLLMLHESVLLRHAAERALELSPNVTVVLGHEHEKCRKALNLLPLTLVVNPNYKEGIGGSIAFGVSQIGGFDRLLVMLCDQPLIPRLHYETLVREATLHPDRIIASEYHEMPGVPAVFPAQYRSALQSLKGDKGAKSLLLGDAYRSVPLNKTEASDIDTQEQWEQVSSLFRAFFNKPLSI